MHRLRLELAAVLLLSACAATPGVQADRQIDGTQPAGPYVLVLGTAQDGGLPQIACEKECCERARRDPQARRLVTSLLLVDPRTGGRWLFDASPDLPEQVERARGHGRLRNAGPGRPQLFDGVFLTHAHMGHYAGLLYLGREAYGVAPPLYTSAILGQFLSTNGPWDALAKDRHVLAPGTPVELGEGLSVTAIDVPHRPEYSDTMAFVIRGPERALLYLPDIDKWERWDRDVEDLLHDVDVALLDASFYADGEIPGRNMAEIAHPFIVESLERFAPLPAEVRSRIWFTHLNHSNPAADPASAAAARVRAAGMRITEDGAVIAL